MHHGAMLFSEGVNFLWMTDIIPNKIVVFGLLYKEKMTICRILIPPI
jgi:hypothetical protein